MVALGVTGRLPFEEADPPLKDGAALAPFRMSAFDAIGLSRALSSAGSGEAEW